MLTKQELIDFEAELVDLYNQGKIRSPIHLSGSIHGNLEDELIRIFQNVKAGDWVFTTYRSHYHALLKGMPKDRLRQWVLENKSIHVMDKEYKVVSSAIVGGTLSQALGVALAIKLQGGSEWVWAFCGDMTSTLGTFKDCLSYASGHKLPITFVIENNGMSTNTPTKEPWGELDDKTEIFHLSHTIYIDYTRKYPHYGTGTRVEFKT